MHVIHIRLLLPHELEHGDGTGLIQCAEDTPCSNGSIATAGADESGSELHRTGYHSRCPFMAYLQSSQTSSENSALRRHPDAAHSTD